MAEKETYPRKQDELDDSLDESDNYIDPGVDAPKRSPMRRKEKFRIKDFKSGKKHKNPKRNSRNTIRHDFEF